MFQTIVNFLSKLFSKEFTSSLTAMIFQLSREDISGEEKKQAAVDYGAKLLNTLEADMVRKLPGGFPQWIAGAIADWLDGAEREWIGAQVETIWAAMKQTGTLMASNPEVAAEMLSLPLTDGKLILEAPSVSPHISVEDPPGARDDQ